MSKRTRKYVHMFHFLDPRVMLAFKEGALFLPVRRSVITHPGADMGVLEERSFVPEHPIGFYYGKLVYRYLSEKRQISTTFYEGLL